VISGGKKTSAIMRAQAAKSGQVGCEESSRRATLYRCGVVGCCGVSLQSLSVPFENGVKPVTFASYVLYDQNNEPVTSTKLERY